mmetsp:Transcript_53472/g.148686  ORF Transcript_53472/g.148686 Transcript_53472/m.148686 type:complete len:299 (+) Transcript_53472:87-983(+)
MHEVVWRWTADSPQDDFAAARANRLEKPGLGLPADPHDLVALQHARLPGRRRGGLHGRRVGGLGRLQYQLRPWYPPARALHRQAAIRWRRRLQYEPHGGHALYRRRMCGHRLRMARVAGMVFLFSELQGWLSAAFPPDCPSGAPWGSALRPQYQARDGALQRAHLLPGRAVHRRRMGPVGRMALVHGELRRRRADEDTGRGAGSELVRLPGGRCVLGDSRLQRRGAVHCAEELHVRRLGRVERLPHLQCQHVPRLEGADEANGFSASGHRLLLRGLFARADLLQGRLILQGNRLPGPR